MSQTNLIRLQMFHTPLLEECMRTGDVETKEIINQIFLVRQAVDAPPSTVRLIPPCIRRQNIEAISEIHDSIRRSLPSHEDNAEYKLGRIAQVYSKHVRLYVSEICF